MTDFIGKTESATYFKALDVAILVIEDSGPVIEALKLYGEPRGIINFKFVESLGDVEELLKRDVFDVMSIDFDLAAEKNNGIGFLRYAMKHFPEQLPTRKMVYTWKAAQIDQKDIKWCEQNNIQVVNKTKDHDSFFKTIDAYFPSYALLPDQPIYAYMKSNEMLIHMARELLAELRSKKEALYSFGGGSEPISYESLANEIESLTPLGKEYLGTWFESIKTTLYYLERKIKL